MGITDGKFYDAKLSKEYYDALMKSMKDFDTNADLVRGAQDAFEGNKLYNGASATAHKKFIKNGCQKMLNDDTNMMADMKRHQEYIMSTFESMVDANPNARMEIDTLEKINVDFKAFYRRFKELTEQTHRVVDNLNAEFGREVGGFPYPDGPKALEPLINICGGDSPNNGYFKECQNMLLSYDEVIHGYLKGQDVPFNTESLNKRIKAVKELINSYAYADPKADEFKVGELDSPKVKEVKVLSKNLDEFCQEVDKYNDKHSDKEAVIRADQTGHVSFPCDFGLIEASKGPQARAVIASPFYVPVKNMVMENSRKDPANPDAYLITPKDAIVSFGVGGAAKSYAENGDLSEIGKNAMANYEAFQQGGTSFMIDKVAGTCSMPGAGSTFMPIGNAVSGSKAMVNMTAYQNAANTVLPAPTSVQGLLNANTAAAGVNGQVTNLWKTMGTAMSNQGNGSAGSVLGNLFEAFGYISVYGSTFFNTKSAGTNGASEQKDIANGVKASVSAMFGGGKNEPQKTIDDYPEYKTGDAEVDAKIVEIIEENGEDLGGLTEMIWYNADVTTQKALSRLIEVNAKYLNDHFENCEEYEKRLENLLGSLSNTQAYQSAESYVYETDNEGHQNIKETYIFNKDSIDALKKYIKDKDVLSFISRIENKTVKGNMVVNHDFDVSLRGVAIEIKMDSSKKTLLYYQTDSRVEKAVDYWDSKGKYNYTKDFFSKEQILEMYKTSKNGEDAEFIDDLLKTNGTYRDVFDVDPNKLSSEMTLVFGRYGYELSDETLNNGNSEPYNNFLSAMSTYQDYADMDKHYAGIGEEGYVKDYVAKYFVAASAITDEYVKLADSTDPYYGIDLGIDDETLQRKLDIASFNQRTAFAVKNAVKDAHPSIDGLDISVDAKTGTLTVSEIDAELRLVDPATINYRWTIEQKDPYTIQLGHTHGSKAVNDLADINIAELEAEKRKLEEDLPANVAIGIVGIFDKRAAGALSNVKLLMEGDKESLIRKGFDEDKVDKFLGKIPGAGTVKKGATTFYDIFSDYNGKLDEIDEQINKYKEMKSVTHFYSASSYANSGASTKGYYLQVDDLDAIRLKQRWEHEGITAVYQDEGTNLNILASNKDNIVDDVCRELKYVIDDQYGNNTIDSDKRKVVEKAMNTILYGSDANNTYDSITDIPDEVMAACEQNIDSTLYGETPGENAIVEQIDAQRD